MTRDTVGVPILRFGLSALFIWFGLSQLGDIGAWTSWVPSWIESLPGLSAETVVLLNGTFELFAGFLLAAGVQTRIVAFILGLHLFFIAFEIGLTAIGVRDFGLAFATLALAFMPADPLTFDVRSRTP